MLDNKVFPQSLHVPIAQLTCPCSLTTLAVLVQERADQAQLIPAVLQVREWAVKKPALALDAFVFVAQMCVSSADDTAETVYIFIAVYGTTEMSAADQHSSKRYISKPLCTCEVRGGFVFGCAFAISCWLSMPADLPPPPAEVSLSVFSFLSVFLLFFLPLSLLSIGAVVDTAATGRPVAP